MSADFDAQAKRAILGLAGVVTAAADQAQAMTDLPALWAHGAVFPG